MKNLISLFFISFLICCSQPGDISIMKQITNDELKKMIESDTAYEKIYESSQYYTKFANKLDSVKFSDITYRDLYDFNNYSNNEKWRKLEEEYGKEWDKEFGIYILKADSIISYWETRVKNESLKTWETPIEIMIYLDNDIESMNEYYKRTIVNKYLDLDFEVPARKTKYRVLLWEALNKEYPLITKYWDKMTENELKLFDEKFKQ